jgi:hypothetical protein
VVVVVERSTMAHLCHLEVKVEVEQQAGLTLLAERDSPILEAEVVVLVMAVA